MNGAAEEKRVTNKDSVASRSCPHKIPVQLVKRLADGPTGEQKWQIEIPDQYKMQGASLESEKGKFFVLIGSLENEQEITKIVRKSL